MMEQQKNADMSASILAFDEFCRVTEEAFQQQMHLDLESERMQKLKDAEIEDMKSVIAHLHKTAEEWSQQLELAQQELRNCNLKIKSAESAEGETGTTSLMWKLQSDKLVFATHLNRAFVKCMPQLVRTEMDGLLAFTAIAEAEKKCSSIGWHLSERIFKVNIIRDLPADAIRWWSLAQFAVSTIHISTQGLRCLQR